MDDTIKLSGSDTDKMEHDEKVDNGVIKQVKCLRCGWTWFPRTPSRPRLCPKETCHSGYWDVPRIRPKRSNN